MKRELRSLTIADREMFLDAAVIMWKYNSSAGLEKYGKQFTSSEEFVAVHALASNDIMCDGFHEGDNTIQYRYYLCVMAFMKVTIQYNTIQYNTI